MSMRTWLAFAGLGLLAAGVGAQEPQQPKLLEDNAKVSYCLGVEAARGFKRQGIEVNFDSFIKGVRDGAPEGKPTLNDAEIREIVNAFQSDARRRMMYARKAAETENRKAGDEFMARNKAEEGVVTLPNGLQYKVLKAGDGKKPTDTDQVECRYRGTLIDGTEFDGTAPGNTATFNMAGVIAGWREALKLMPVGSKWRIVIPPELAYGSRGTGRGVGPNATLVFEIELVSIK